MGTCEKSLGLTFVALSRLKKFKDLLLNPISYDRLSDISKSVSLKPRREEEKRLDILVLKNLNDFNYWIDYKWNILRYIIDKISTLF